MIRLHVPDPLAAGAVVVPSADQARYLVGVMRQGLGDSVLLFNGRDGEWRAQLVEVSKKGCRLAAVERVREQTSPPDLDLIVALVKRGPLETIVEKAVELGARRIRLALTRRTNADHTNVARLQAIATEDWFGIVNIRIQRPSKRSVLTALNDCDPPDTCMTASVRPCVGRIPFISSGRWSICAFISPVIWPWRSGEHQTCPSDHIDSSRSSRTAG
jgi:hypothetical protein